MPPWSLVDVVETIGAARQQPADLVVLLTRVARIARDTVPRADHASFLIRHPDGHLQSVAATGIAIADVDGLQCRLREGPAFDAVTFGQTTDSGDLANDADWPAYGPAAAALGFRSQLAMRVHDGLHARIALSLYARDWGAFAHPGKAARVLVDYAQAALVGAGDLTTAGFALTGPTDISRAPGIRKARGRTNFPPPWGMGDGNPEAGCAGLAASRVVRG